MKPLALILLPLLIVLALTGCGDDENPLQANETFSGRWAMESGLGVKFIWELSETNEGLEGNLYQEVTGTLGDGIEIIDSARKDGKISFSVVDESVVIIIEGTLIPIDSMHVEATFFSDKVLEMKTTFCDASGCASATFPAFRQQVGF